MNEQGGIHPYTKKTSGKANTIKELIKGYVQILPRGRFKLSQEKNAVKPCFIIYKYILILAKFL
jgi:hypothetical protein